MAEYNIKKTDFDEQKNKLKKFSEQPVTNVELDKFDTGANVWDFFTDGIPGLINGHRVTGEELNDLIVRLQKCFIEINNHNRQVVREFGQIYETFDVLDKEYIQGILIGVKSAEKASQEAKEAQKGVNETLEVLQKTVYKLKEFKTEVNGYIHLKDIDEIWNNLQQLNVELGNNFEKLTDQYVSISRKVSEITQFKIKIEKNKHINDIDYVLRGVSESLTIQSKEVNILKNKFANVKHINDIDLIWNDVKKLQNSTLSLSQSLNKKAEDFTKEILELQVFKESQNNFDKVDMMWDKVQLCMANLNEYISLQKQVEEKLLRLDQSVVKIVSMEHINDVDDIWKNVKNLLKEIKDISNGQEKISSDLELQSQQLDILKNNLTKIEHIKDVDTIWGDVCKINKEIQELMDFKIELSKNFKQKMDNFKEEIFELQELKNSQQHFSDVDMMWDKLQMLETMFNEYKSSQKQLKEKMSPITSFVLQIKDMEHIDDIDEEWKYSHLVGENLENSIIRLSDMEDKFDNYNGKIQNYENENLHLKQQMKTAYIIAGGAMGISIIQIILLIMGIL